MNRYSGYFFSFLISILSAAPTVGQGESDSLSATTDSKRTLLGVSIDYGKILTLPTKFETKVEVGIDLTFGRKWVLMSEFGYGDLKPENAIKNGFYESSGFYFRGGLGYAMEVVPLSFLTLGVMYGQSNFQDKGLVVIRSAAWQDFEELFERTSLTSEWVELIMITEQRFRSNFALGVKFRVRRLINFENDYQPPVYTIPGYGRAFDNSIPAVNFFIKYIIPL